MTISYSAAGLATLIKNLGHKVLFEADNGRYFIEQLNADNMPDIVLMDINMPQMDGYDTSKWLKEQHSSVKVLALSMYNNYSSIIRMLRSGAKGYILKDSHPLELQNAIEALMNNGFYYSDVVNGKLIYASNKMDNGDIDLHTLTQLTERENIFKVRLYKINV